MIIQGNALDVMQGMPDKCVDMIFTSPPFKEEDVGGGYWQEYDKWMTEFYRITSKAIVIIHSATKLKQIITKYPPKRTMIWGKGISQYSWRWNPIFVYQISDDYKVNKYIWSDCFGVEAVTGKWKVHKYQDPELLYSTIIRMFKGCDTIIDPFCGSGTTGVACIQEGRKFVGIELNPEYVKLAEARLVASPVTLPNILN